MSDDTEEISVRERERIAKLVVKDLNTPERSLAIHEAGHAVVALDLGLMVVDVSLGATEKEEGESLGRMRTPPMRELFSQKEIDDHTETVLTHVFNRIAVLEGGREARRQIQGKTDDGYAQIDESEIRNFLKQFPELHERRPSPQQVCAQVVTTGAAPSNGLPRNLCNIKRLSANRSATCCEWAKSARAVCARHSGGQPGLGARLEAKPDHSQVVAKWLLKTGRVVEVAAALIVS